MCQNLSPIAGLVLYPGTEINLNTKRFPDAMFTGAMAVAAIRLCWDPTLYMPLRALCPRELAALIALLGAGAACLTLLSHLPDISRPRALLAVYFYVGGIAILCEVAGAVWVCERVWRWYRQEGNEMIQRAGRLAEHTLRLLQEAENWWPAAGAARALLHEIRIVLPQYAWMVAGCVVLYACVRLCALFVAALLLYSPRFPRLKYKKVHIDTVPA